MSVQRYRQTTNVSLRTLQTIVDPGAALGTIGLAPEVDVTLADDTQLSTLDSVMLALGYVFVATAPAASNPTKGSATLLDIPATASPIDVAPAGISRLRYDNTQKAILLSIDGGAFSTLAVNPANGASFFEDFLTQSGTILGASNWIAVTSGAGSAANVGGGAAPATLNAIHQGILTMQTGATATGRASARQSNLAYSNVAATAGGNSRLELLATLGDVLPTAVEDYTVMCGWSDNAGVAGYGANAALLVIDRALSATNWVAKSVVGGVPTNTVTAIPVSAAGTYDKLLVDLSSTTTARFFINGVLGATHALATLPAATVGWAPITKIEKLVGTAQRRLHIDYASWSYRLSTAR